MNNQEQPEQIDNAPPADAAVSPKREESVQQENKSNGEGDNRARRGKARKPSEPIEGGTETLEKGTGSLNGNMAERNENGGRDGEEELASKTLQIQSKRFYIDVKQNRRGRFIKIAEVDGAGRKSRLLFAMSTAGDFRDHLTDFSEHYASLGPVTTERGANAAAGRGAGQAEAGHLKTESIFKDDRRYYMDLIENQRGRYLRVSMTMSQSRQRFQIAIPAQGMIEIRNALTDLLNEFGGDDLETKDDLPEARSLRTDSKMFYFDVGRNTRGTYMRISEVRNNYRNAITIPERWWPKFRDVFGEFVSQKERIPIGGPAGEASNVIENQDTNSEN